ncbi:2-dehydro-3-deoxygalactonokinase [Paracoccus seriniphilus]|uniref:2-keto-3-deoxygalactonate kinase n=2 Tax=Paracoccus seriniphilus TaxID=184748 RepID=A0A239PZP3_9RHOB|nr:2-dehydro-3-deoxygalactonokinase [Paracoccus seriniphilus]SNT75483.1 2-keto-3-deoxygalactonate kinase [Paracoccus seriniphilus]
MSGTDSMEPAAPEWIAVDWGTSNLRVWLMDAQNRVIAERHSDKGMSSLSAAEYEPVLLELIGPATGSARRLDVICCGMAGSRQGWAEAPYRAVPCSPVDFLAATRVETNDPRLSVRILPGLRQDVPDDVMRGEETQIGGFLAEKPDFEGTVCLPGTHCKWVRIRDGKVLEFRSFMTGELFALLSGASVLRHSVDTDEFDQEHFLIAVMDALNAPQSLTSELFSLRAASLLRNVAPVATRSRLSGLLIGTELAAARSFWQDQPVAIIGASGLGRSYQAALESQGNTAEICDVAEQTMRGLCAARAAWKEVTNAT